MAETLRWYLALLPLLAVGLLPAALLFERLHSRGVWAARPLAWVLASLAIWLTARLTPIPYGTPLVISALALLGGASAAIAWRRPNLLARLHERWPLLLAQEAVFASAFALIALVRAQAPAAAATEKPMDLMLLTTIHRSDQLPPADPWLGGFDVSYYHLGHLGVDIVGRVAATTPGESFVLGVALAGALAGAAIFGLAGDLLALGTVRRGWSLTVAGLVAAACVLLLAPLEGLFELLAANGLGAASMWEALGVDRFPGPTVTTRLAPDQFWWWWRSTRVLPGTITEFPAFSLVLGDLHAHLLALPAATLSLGLALVAFEGGTPLTWRRWRRRPAVLLLTASILAAQVLTNTWDAGLYGLIWLAAASGAFIAIGWPLGGAIVGAVRGLLPPVLLAALLSAPFLATVEGPELGVDLVGAGGSDPVRLALVWLPLALLPLAAAGWLRLPVARRAALVAGGLASLGVLAWMMGLLGGARGAEIGERGAGWLTLLLLIAAIAAGGGATIEALRRSQRGHAAWLGAATLVAAIVLGTELIYVVDAFDDRMNTVFKLWYGGWLVLALAAGGAAGSMADRLARPRGTRAILWLILPAVAVVLTLGGMLYTPAAAVSRAREGHERGVDALAYLDREDPARAQAVRWVRAHLDPGAALLLEAPGESYSSGNLVSAFSGVPTVLGWGGHELQWRGRGAWLAARAEAVDRLYLAGATAPGWALARQLGVTHIYLGTEEQLRYSPAIVDAFAAWPAVFEAGHIRIVEVPVPPAEGEGGQ